SVSVLLEAKADPYLETKSGISPAVLAADRCSLPILKLLKNAGVDFNRPTKKGLLPIYTAVARAGCDRKFLQFLVESGSTIESPTASGVTPLMHAIRYTNMDAIRFLFEQNVSAAPVDKHGRDALYYLLGPNQAIAAIDGGRGSRWLPSWEEIKEIVIYLTRKGIPLYREYKDGQTPLLLLFDFPMYNNGGGEDIRDLFFQYCKKNQIDLNRPNRFGLTPFQFYKLIQKFENQKSRKGIDRILLNLNAKNPSAAFHALFLINWKTEDTTIRTVLESFLKLPKLPDLEWLEPILWKKVLTIFHKDTELKKLLLNRFPEPPAGIWDLYKGVPNDPEELKLWLHSIQKGKSVQLVYNFLNEYEYSLQTINVHEGIDSALNECRLDLLEKLSSQPSLWQLTNPEGFSNHFYYINCEDQKEEQKLYQLLQSVHANPGKDDWIRYSPLCSEVPTEDQSKNPNIRERSLKRISTLLKMGASPNCYVSRYDWVNGYTTALDAARKYGLNDLEELLLSFGAEDPRKLPLQKAIVAKDKNEIQKLLDQGAIIDFEELKLAKEHPELLSYLLEEYNSLRGSPLFEEILNPEDRDHANVKYDHSFLEILLKKGFSLKIRSTERTKGVCAISYLLELDLKSVESLLKYQNIENYPCRGFQFRAFTKETEEKIKNLKLDSIFPEFQEESFLYEYKSE
ncbi:ankyrin repeat domain-containing protein, partial [Leptospira alexanderi]|uniref:ankyrin repeat domain-containing protein n=1 Tax=Leptospira alexanderi TaxID=100053 RepID=UPI001115A16B